LTADNVYSILKSGAAWAFGMGLELITFHDFTDWCIACNPFGNPKRSVESMVRTPY
jgi:hypothetical protein